MLTSLYYYNHYRPYIVSNRETGGYAPKRNRIADRREAADSSRPVYVLNKSLKNEIVSYAQNVSYGVTNLRSITRQTAKDMENFNRNVRKDGLTKAQNYLEEDLSEFTERYNTASSFMQQQTQSPELRTFSYEIADNLTYHQDRLTQIGLHIGEGGRVEFDREYFEGLSQGQIKDAIQQNVPVFSGLQRHAGNFLTEPLVDHMNFKGLGYHYNYAMGKMEADGFGILEAGLLIDTAV